jgi:hypothetical protein
LRDAAAASSFSFDIGIFFCFPESWREHPEVSFGGLDFAASSAGGGDVVAGSDIEE